MSYFNYLPSGNVVHNLFAVFFFLTLHFDNMKFRFKQLFLSLLVSASTSASAGVILDTGPGNSSSSGYTVSKDQWLAAKFKVDEASVITGFQGWLNGSAGTLRMEIFSSSAGLPGASLYAGDAFQVAGPVSWAGISGMNLLLEPGTYFAAFEVPTGYTYNGNMPYDEPNPVQVAHLYPRLGYWDKTSIQIGVRVFGEPASEIPAPGSFSLIALGAVVLAMSRRKRI